MVFKGGQEEDGAQEFSAGGYDGTQTGAGVLRMTRNHFLL